MYDGSTYWIWLSMSSIGPNNNVTQTADDSTNSNFEVIFSNTADNTTRTEAARKSSKLKFNPSTGNLQATQLNGVTVGSSPKFTDTNDSVRQWDTSGNSDYRVVFSGNANDTSEINAVRKSSKLTFNPSTSELKLNSKYVPASTTIKEIQLVSSLPADASSHPEILYLVGGS